MRSPGRQREATPAGPLFSYGLAMGGLVAVTVLFLAGRLPVFVAIGYWVLSVVSVIAYALDKSSARRGGQRLSENSLHLISLLGGWPGALVAQQVFRHKTTKHAFRAVFWITVLVNIAFVVWLVSTGVQAPAARL